MEIKAEQRDAKSFRVESSQTKKSNIKYDVEARTHMHNLREYLIVNINMLLMILLLTLFVYSVIIIKTADFFERII